MTPDQTAKKIVECLKRVDVIDFDLLETDIATALRTARNEVLEEAAVWHDEKSKEWSCLARESRDLGMEEVYHVDAKRSIEHSISATQIRALKHKDGQP